MLTRYRWLPLAMAAILAGCQDATAPLGRRDVAGGGITADWYAGLDSANHILRQASAAPRLETYQVSFWASRDRWTQVTVNYLPEAGQAYSLPFLWFDIPRDGLRAGGGGSELHKRDSVLITLTIDTVNFIVDFEPEGVMFDQHHPAMLYVFYQHADSDLNRDGVVDGTDEALRAQLHIVTRPVKRAHWHWTKSEKGLLASLPYVYAPMRHFSQWAVSW